MVRIFLITIMVLDLLALILLGFFVYNVSSPLNNFQEDSRTVVIEPGSGLNDIASKLSQEGIIDETSFFILYTVLEGRDGQLKAGTYTFTPDMNVKNIVALLTEGRSKDFRRVTFPEGFTSKQMAIRLVEEGVLANEEEFLNLAKISTEGASDIFEYDFLSSIDAASLEGFLFPDTYQFHVEEEAVNVIDKMLQAFENKAHPLLDNYEGDPYSLLIKASLLEEEVQSEKDMRIVAGIIENRLSINMALQIDATLAYITGKQTSELTNADKEIDSPYNTYQNRGLPPAPISNPGIRAISAALDPADTEYFYYLTGRDGITYFAKTLEEHNRNKELYLR